MEVAKTIEELKQAVQKLRSEGHRIGLVPTMGFLHEGHLRLVDRCKEVSDKTILTIFVNPTQFGPNEDLDAYPRDEERDLKLCEERGVDLVFCPNVEDMYGASHSTFVIEERASKGLCGISRPIHFRGVLTICCKLFMLSRCDVAVFGQKDAQQVILIEKMVRELNFSVEIVRGEIIRESDGLAMSSRNRYLTESERKIAPCLQEALQIGKALIEGGQTEAAKIRDEMAQHIEKHPEIRIDYLELVDVQELTPLSVVRLGEVLIAGAIYIGKTRLIDNVNV